MTGFKIQNVDTEGDDEILSWTKLRKGEKSGLENLYVLFSDELFRYGMAVIADRELVKDCIQELFIDLWKYRKSLSPTNNVRLYLCRSLTNRVIKLSKKEIKRAGRGLDMSKDLDLESPLAEFDLAGFEEGEASFSRLQAAMDALPQKQRQVIQHVYFEQLSGDKVSQIMGINLQSVYNLTSKAIAGLRKRMVQVVFILTFLMP
jgi:RNA polymerase sigma factor (sigma-70 family)